MGHLKEMKIKMFNSFVLQIRVELISIQMLCASHWLTVIILFYCVMYVTKFASGYILFSVYLVRNFEYLKYYATLFVKETHTTVRESLNIYFILCYLFYI